MLRFFVNVWRFRKELAKYKTWDYVFCLMIFRRSLELLHKSVIDNAYTNRDLKSAAKIETAIEIMNTLEDNEKFVEMAEKELGEIGINDVHTSNVFKKADEIETQYWEELWTILKGTDSDEFDGTDMRTWW